MANSAERRFEQLAEQCLEAVQRLHDAMVQLKAESGRQHGELVGRISLLERAVLHGGLHEEVRQDAVLTRREQWPALHHGNAEAATDADVQPKSLARLEASAAQTSGLLSPPTPGAGDAAIDHAPTVHLQGTEKSRRDSKPISQRAPAHTLNALHSESRGGRAATDTDVGLHPDPSWDRLAPRATNGSARGNGQQSSEVQPEFQASRDGEVSGGVEPEEGSASHRVSAGRPSSHPSSSVLSLQQKPPAVLSGVQAATAWAGGTGMQPQQALPPQKVGSSQQQPGGGGQGALGFPEMFNDDMDLELLDSFFDPGELASGDVPAANQVGAGTVSRSAAASGWWEDGARSSGAAAVMPAPPVRLPMPQPQGEPVLAEQSGEGRHRGGICPAGPSKLAEVSADLGAASAELAAAAALAPEPGAATRMMPKAGAAGPAGGGRGIPFASFMQQMSVADASTRHTDEADSTAGSHHGSAATLAQPPRAPAAHGFAGPGPASAGSRRHHTIHGAGLAAAAGRRSDPGRSPQEAAAGTLSASRRDKRSLAATGSAPRQGLDASALPLEKVSRGERKRHKTYHSGTHAYKLINASRQSPASPSGGGEDAEAIKDLMQWKGDFDVDRGWPGRAAGGSLADDSRLASASALMSAQPAAAQPPRLPQAGSSSPPDAGPQQCWSSSSAGPSSSSQQQPGEDSGGAVEGQSSNLADRAACTAPSMRGDGPGGAAAGLAGGQQQPAKAQPARTHSSSVQSDEWDELEEGSVAENGPNGMKVKSLTYEVLSQNFHLSLKDAAAKLGVCATTLKRACRKAGISRWPKRQVGKLSKAIQRLGLVGDEHDKVLKDSIDSQLGPGNAAGAGAAPGEAAAPTGAAPAAAPAAAAAEAMSGGAPAAGAGPGGEPGGPGGQGPTPSGVKGLQHLTTRTLHLVRSIEKRSLPGLDEMARGNLPESLVAAIREARAHSGSSSSSSSRTVALKPGGSGRPLPPHAGPDEVQQQQQRSELAATVSALARSFGGGAAPELALDAAPAPSAWPPPPPPPPPQQQQGLGWVGAAPGATEGEAAAAGAADGDVPAGGEEAQLRRQLQGIFTLLLNSKTAGSGGGGGGGDDDAAAAGASSGLESEPPLLADTTVHNSSTCGGGSVVLDGGLGADVDAGLSDVGAGCQLAELELLDSPPAGLPGSLDLELDGISVPPPMLGKEGREAAAPASADRWVDDMVSQLLMHDNLLGS